MKIRTDFVTNSSSSSFSLVLTVRGTDGNEVIFEDQPPWEDGGEASFKGDLRAIVTPFSSMLLKEIIDRDHPVSAENPTQEKRMRSVKPGDELRLVKDGPYTKEHNGLWMETYQVTVKRSNGPIGSINGETNGIIALMDLYGDNVKAVASGGTAADVCLVRILIQNKRPDPVPAGLGDVAALAGLLMTAEENDYHKANSKKKQGFVSSVKKQICSADRIETISVERRYSAWGEFADLIPENDRILRALAEKAILCEDDKRPEAIQEMREYVLSSNPKRAMNFGAGFDDFRYTCNTDDEAMLHLAMKLCMRDGPERVKGREYSEINLQTGESQAFAAFDLTSYTSGRGLENITVEDAQQKIMEERRGEEARRQEQKEAWLRLFGDVLSPDPHVVISDHVFVFAGIYGGEYYRIVEEHGGIIRTSVSGKTDYLVVNPSGTYREGKIDKALEQQAKGKKVQIILPEDLENAL